MTSVAIVVPAFNEASNLAELVQRIERSLMSEQWELLIIDDGSTDDTLGVLKRLSLADARIRYLSLSRNFGHQMALKAGLDHAVADCVISLDADMQHPPERIPDMLREWRAGAEVVNMLRIEHNVPLFKRVTSRWFYSLTNAISDYRVEPGSSDFRLLDRKVVEVVRGIHEHNLFLRGLIPWLGFRQVSLTYEPSTRRHGESKYSYRKMFRLAVHGITSSSVRPLHTATLVGLAMSIAAVGYAAYALWIRFSVGTAIAGWTSVLISILLIGGIQLVMLGLIGEYLGRTLTQVKARPCYVLRDHNLTAHSMPASATTLESQKRVYERASSS